MNDLDQFYTNSEVAKKCFEEFKKNTNIVAKVVYIEPSAGSGSFFGLLPEKSRIGLDLEPKYPGILQGDFFDYNYPNIDIDNELVVVVIGNPPFGKVSSLAIKFFNHSAKFADYIAFVVPRTFKRTSVINRLDSRFHLLSNTDLPEKGCFTPDINAKCCFQIWKKETARRDILVLQKVCDDFAFVKYGEKDFSGQPTVPGLGNFDFAVKAFGSNCGEIFTENLSDLRPKSYHFIKSNIDTGVLISVLKSLDYSISKDTVRQNSLGKADLVRLYLEGKK